MDEETKELYIGVFLITLIAIAFVILLFYTGDENSRLERELYVKVNSTMTHAEILEKIDEICANSSTVLTSLDCESNLFHMVKNK